MNNLQRFLQGYVVVRLRNEKERMVLKKTLEAMRIEYCDVLNYKIWKMKELFQNPVNRDYPLTYSECICYEYTPGKGITCGWEHKYKKAVEDEYFDEMVDFDSLELDKIIKNFKNI